MTTNNYNKKLEMGRLKLNSLMDWAYNQGKNDESEFNYKRIRNDKVEDILVTKLHKGGKHE